MKYEVFVSNDGKRLIIIHRGSTVSSEEILKKNGFKVEDFKLFLEVYENRPPEITIIEA